MGEIVDTTEAEIKRPIEEQKPTSTVEELPRPFIRGALTTSDSGGGRGDGNDGNK